MKTETNALVSLAGLAEGYLFRIWYRLMDGEWIESTTTGTSGNDAFGRLIRRVRNGEVDPREDSWKLVPVK